VSGLCVGLDIGATKTLGLVIDDAGEILAEVREATEQGSDGVVRTAARVVEALRAATGEPLAGTVGIGMPGLVDTEKGTVKHAVNLGVDGDWLPLGDLVSDRLGVPVVVENDVNAATLGAVAMSGEDDLVYVSIGTGLAAGLVLEGRLRRGEHGAAGEIGHVPVDPHGILCTCGQRGCLETLASGSAVAAAWPGAGDVPPAQALFAAAQAGDPDAVAARDRFSAGVAAAIRMLSLAVDPRAIVLGGGVAQLGEQLRVAVAGALLDQAASSPFLASLDLAGRLRVVPSTYPVAAVGAALLGR
jgi:predicted NBD/HSP70 family sugar kinase